MNSDALRLEVYLLLNEFSFVTFTLIYFQIKFLVSKRLLKNFIFWGIYMSTHVSQYFRHYSSHFVARNHMFSCDPNMNILKTNGFPEYKCYILLRGFGIRITFENTINIFCLQRIPQRKTPPWVELAAVSPNGTKAEGWDRYATFAIVAYLITTTQTHPLNY